MFFYLALGSRAESVTPNCVNNSPKFYWKYGTSFSSISYCSKGEYWTQKCIQSESIHSTTLDVRVLKEEQLFIDISFGRTRVVEAQFQIEASDQTENRLRHASGLVQLQFRYISWLVVPHGCRGRNCSMGFRLFLIYVFIIRLPPEFLSCIRYDWAVMCLQTWRSSAV